MNVADIKTIGPRQRLFEDIRAADHHDAARAVGRPGRQRPGGSRLLPLAMAPEPPAGVCVPARASSSSREKNNDNA